MSSAYSSDNIVVSLYFRVGKRLLGYIGFWPLDHLNRLIMIKVFINLIVLLIAISGEIRSTWMMRVDFIELLDAVCPCLTKIVTWIKLASFLIYRKELAVLLSKIVKHLTEDTKDQRKNSMIDKISFLVNIWWMVLGFFGLSVHIIYIFKPIFIWAYHRFIDGINDAWIDLPYQTALPYQDMTQINNKLLYSIVYILMVHSGSVTILGFPGVDGMFIALCMYISIGYGCLREDLKKTFQDYSKADLSPKTNDVVYEKLSYLIRREQNIIKIFNNFSRIYKFIILCHFLFASIILGVLLMNIKFATGMTRAVYIPFGIGACVQLFTYCYGAECIKKNIFETLYFSDWYRYDKRVNTLIIFILLNNQEGSLMKVPFFVPSFPLFCSIIKTSGSYFTLLQTFL